MWFVSKKKYNEMVAERDKWDGIASEAIAQNGRLLTQIDKTIKEMKDIQELNHRIVKLNDELVAHCKELEAKLNSTTRHIQLADGTIFAIEEALYRQRGDEVIQSYIDEYYEEVELLDTK